MRCDETIDVSDATTPTKSPFLSVCLPTYNRSHSLARAIRSALDQSFVDFELVISDNASTDNTREVVASFDDSRIRAVFWTDLASMYANHNRCVDLARGQWIVFLHSDDEFPPGYLSQVANEIVTATDEEIVCNRQYTEQHVMALRPGHNEPLAVLAFTVLANGHSPSGLGYKTEAFAKYGKFHEDSPFADGVLLVQWAGLGAALRLFDYQPRVWSVRPGSDINALMSEPGSSLFAVPILDTAFHGPRADELRQYLLKNAPQLPIKLQVRLLCRLYQCGYREEAEAVSQAIGHKWQMLGYHKFYLHMLPLRYAPKLYWPVMLNSRRITRAFRTALTGK
jgi:glycosyltransferase involved in cell wall biosynthesis